ncbi:Tyrosine-protein phosphatase dsp1 [Irineochytrium annulatum]|nr:Tyrosine-protein phosphatase dsp1 [Irineochytrium annulatum]
MSRGSLLASIARIPRAVMRPTVAAMLALSLTPIRSLAARASSGRGRRVTASSVKATTTREEEKKERDRMRELRVTLRELPSPSIAFPQRPRAAFSFFAGDTVRQMHASHPDVPASKLMVYASEKWKALSNKEKKVWHKKAENDRLRYEDELQSYKENRTPRDLLIERVKRKIMNELGMRRKVAKLATIDTEAPKRPLTGYMRYAHEFFAAQKSRAAGGRVLDLTKKAAKIWNDMSAKEKKKYVAMYEKDQSAYQEKMKLYKEENDIDRERALLKEEIGELLDQHRAKRDAPKLRRLEREKAREKIRKAKLRAAEQKKRKLAAARERKKVAAAKEKEKKTAAKEKEKAKAAAVKEREQKKVAAVKEKKKAAAAKERERKKMAAAKEKKKARAAEVKEEAKTVGKKRGAKTMATLKPKATKVAKATPKKATGRSLDPRLAKALALAKAKLAARSKSTEAAGAAPTKTAAKARKATKEVEGTKAAKTAGAVKSITGRAGTAKKSGGSAGKGRKK